MDTSFGGMPEQDVNIKELDAHQSARKSKRIPKSRLLGEVFDDEENDDEIRYLEKLRTSRLASNYGADYDDDDEVGSKKQKIISRISNTEAYNYNGDSRYNHSRSHKESVVSQSGRAFEDDDYFEEEESLSDDEPEPKKKNLNKEIHVSADFETEMAVTTRQRALKRGKAVSVIEFPNGLPPAPPKSEQSSFPSLRQMYLLHFNFFDCLFSLLFWMIEQKERKSDMEQQLKKAEAAEKRRMQVEKAAQEAEVILIVHLCSLL